ncbi:Molybdate-anion transporter [Frankliniella fusca]|uniref:Molybdate-anion transporter n=1 Tax=Frankliniella fusca TaxID=407009 RepID=A0AAE1HYR0_9NEOP|nr:Molybdate-anion transporter [Frankliniella fusca]
MFLEYSTIVALATATLVLFLRNRNNYKQIQDHQNDFEKVAMFKLLQQKYLFVYLLATFSDWLQGPYVYRLYHEYNFDDTVISKLFLAGFLSSSLFGSVVGHLADRYGRKKLCVIFCLLYSFCCFTKAFQSIWILLVSRFLSGIATSILFSAFNAWYIHEHLQHHQLPPEWMNDTFAKATFYNGLLAVVAGFVSSIAADFCGWGPLAPFMIAIPILLTACIVTSLSWEENCGQDSAKSFTFRHSTCKSFHLIFSPREKTLLHLGVIQMLYESAVYTFVIAWSPLLIPLNFSLGLVFAAFMLSIMLGSIIYSSIIKGELSSPENMLSVSMKMATVSMAVVAALTAFETSEIMTQVCYVAFLVFEVSVGIYFPAWGYLAGRTVPEDIRASVVSWFRLPMNLLTCICLQWTWINKNAMKTSVTPASTYHSSFVMCVGLLLIACWSSQRFSTHYLQKQSVSSGVV